MCWISGKDPDNLHGLERNEQHYCWPVVLGFTYNEVLQDYPIEKWYEYIMDTWPISFVLPYSIVVLVNLTTTFVMNQ